MSGGFKVQGHTDKMMAKREGLTPEKEGYEVWKCPACESIYVYEGGNNSPVMVYRSET